MVLGFLFSLFLSEVTSMDERVLLICGKSFTFSEFKTNKTGIDHSGKELYCKKE